MTMNPHTESDLVNTLAASEFACDLLRGADEINEFIFGRTGSRRKIYYLAETSCLPVFRLGSMLCARKSVLLRWIAGHEGRFRPEEEKS